MFSLSNLLKWVNIFLWLLGEDQGKGDDSTRVDEEVNDLFLFVFPRWSRVLQSGISIECARVYCTRTY
jgi:hypothetical protein